MRLQFQGKTRMQQRFDWFYLLIASFSMCSLGNFAVMTILAIYFLKIAPAQAGGLLLFTTLSFGLSRLFIAPVVDRIPLRLAMGLALFLASVGYLGLTVTRTPLLVVLLLFIISLGHSSNVLLVKLLVAQSSSRDSSKQSQFSRFALVITGVNIAGAIGSSIGGILLIRWGPEGVFLLAAISYAISGVIALCIPTIEMSKPQQRLNWLLALRLTLKQPAIWRALIFTILGLFLYTQIFSSLPIFISDKSALNRPDLLGSIFALNAVLLIAGQLPITKAVLYLRIPISQLVLLAFLGFAGGFALLWLFPSTLIVYVAVIIWTLAEMLLFPALDTLIAEGALVEYRQAAFALDTIIVALSQGLGNLFGVSVGSFLLDNHYSFSVLYTILTFGAIGATVITIFVAKRNESIVFRLLKGQSPIPTGQTQMLQPLLQPIEKGGIGQSLLTWLSAGSLSDNRRFIEAHPEIIALDTGQLVDFIAQQPEQWPRETITGRLSLLRDIRRQFARSVRMAYVNMYGGLILDLPKWLEELKQQLTNTDEENSQQTASSRMTRLDAAIRRARDERSIASEIVAELHVLYASATLEMNDTTHAEAVEGAIASLQEALKVYTLVQYPYQYARTHVFLSSAFQDRANGSRRANLAQALASYEAAIQGYRSDPFAMPVATSQLTNNDLYNQDMISKKLVELEQAMAQCQMTLQDLIQEENERNEPTQKLIPLSERFDSDNTILLSENFDPDKTILRHRTGPSYKEQL